MHITAYNLPFQPGGQDYSACLVVGIMKTTIGVLTKSNQIKLGFISVWSQTGKKLNKKR